MNTRLRIQTIRLIERIQQNSEYASRIGISVEERKGSGNKTSAAPQKN